MSIAEFPGQGRSNQNADLQFERTPPQDLVAEQGVLGGMLLSKDAIADVVEIIRDRDFYRPAHELIYDAILDLYGRGEPADPVTVAAELTKRGEIARDGLAGLAGDGLAELHVQADAADGIAGPLHHAVAHFHRDVDPVFCHNRRAWRGKWGRESLFRAETGRLGGICGLNNFLPPIVAFRFTPYRILGLTSRSCI